MRIVKDIANNIRFKYYGASICSHFCSGKTKKCNFYDWFGYFDGKFIKQMCEKCALRERWGYNYKQQKKYKSWVGS